MVHIVTCRLAGDRHDWMLTRGARYKCALCGYTMPVEPYDSLIFGSGCPKSEVVMESQKVRIA